MTEDDRFYTKLDDAIKYLQEIRERHGNIPVGTWNCRDDKESDNVEIIVRESRDAKDKRVLFL